MIFREMRRKNQKLTEDECLEILRHQTSGVLAVSGDDGYPYAVPLSYVYADSKIHFHCALSGHKTDAIRKNSKVSFCVISKDEIVANKYTTYFRSVIVFGKANIITDESIKRKVLEKLVDKYSSEYKKGGKNEIDLQISKTCIIEMLPEHISGKEATELVNNKHS